MRPFCCLCLLASPALASGQCRAPVVFPAPYAAPVYHAPVVVEKVVVKEIPFAVPVPFALFAFSVPPTTPPPVLVAAPAAAPAPAPAAVAAPPPSVAPCAAVEARLARLEAALRQAPAGDAPPVALGEALASVPEAYPPAPAAPVPRVRTDYPGALGPAVAALAARGCAQCHTGSASRGDVTLWNDRGEWQPGVDWGSIHAAVRPRKGRDGSVLPARMPKGQPVKLSEAEVALVRRMRDSEGD